MLRLTFLETGKDKDGGREEGREGGRAYLQPLLRLTFLETSEGERVTELALFFL